jgi:surface antigen
MQSALGAQSGGRWAARLLGIVLVASSALANGCAGMSNTDRGVLGGGAAGAGIGAAVGSLTHHTGAGAVIGGLTGAVAGGLIGNGVDEKQHREAAERYAADHPPPSLQDVATMTQQGVSDDVIIAQIQNSHAAYTLTADQIVWLKQSGVHDCVIRTMQLSGGYPRHVYAVAPVQPVYVVEPPPPPPVAVGIGFHGTFR